MKREKISLETVTELTHMLLNNEFNLQASQKALPCLCSPVTFCRLSLSLLPELLKELPCIPCPPSQLFH